MAGKRKPPGRTCIGCGAVKDKRELIRIVRSPEGSFSLDLTGRANGRGAYLCRDGSCLEAALKRHGLERSFRMEIPPDTAEALREEWKQLDI